MLQPFAWLHHIRLSCLTIKNFIKVDPFSHLPGNREAASALETGSSASGRPEVATDYDHVIPVIKLQIDFVANEPEETSTKISGNVDPDTDVAADDSSEESDEDLFGGSDGKVRTDESGSTCCPSGVWREIVGFSKFFGLFDVDFVKCSDAPVFKMKPKKPKS